MSNKNFGQFTQESSPTTAQFVVGYDTAVSGGERRYAFSDVLGLFRTQVFSTANGILQADGAGNVTSTGLTYSGSTLSVPAGFVVSGAGSIALTAGGSNQNVTITPSGTGGVGIGVAGGGTAELYVVNRGVSAPVAAWNALSGIPAGSFLGEATTGNGDLVIGYAADTGFGSTFAGRKSRGTLASPTTVQAGDRGLYITSSVYDGSNFLNSSSIQFDVTTAASGLVPQDISFATSTTGTGSRSKRVAILATGTLSVSISNAANSAWGTSGIVFRANAATHTDSSSSGTVATAVANSFAVPTFAASSATTYTNAANLYIAGDVAAGSGATLTNSYGLWNAGKTRLDGAVLFGGNLTLSGTALITKPGGTIPIFTTNTAITTGAGAQAGTLLNSPAAGNPTKWIPINDNGTTRYIPAW